MTESAKTSSTTYTYHDPSRHFDGDPYEASGQSVDQMGHVLALLKRATNDTATQVRNAYMQRNLDSSSPADAAGWETSAEHKLLAWFSDLIDQMQVRLKALHRATTYDPAHPPKE